MEVSNLMARSDRPTIIKRHATRRLYNTRTGRYIARSHLAEMAAKGEDFIVYDTKSGEDITRSVLIQIVQGQETREPQPLLPAEFLKQLIRFYGDSLIALLAFYLDFSVVTLTNHDLREKAVQAGASAGALLDDQVRRNIEFFERIIAGFQPTPGTDDKNRPSARIRTR